MRMGFGKGAVVLLAMLAVAGGCTVGPDYEAPVVEAPPEFVSQDVLSQLDEGAGGDPASRWWEGFEDEQLNELVEAALAANPTVAAAAARLREARAAVRLARSGGEPALGSGIDAGAEQREQLEPEEDSTSTTSLFGFLGLTVPLDVFGQTKRRVEAAQAREEAAEAQLREEVLLTSSEIVREYMALRGNQRQLELLRESVELQEQTLSIVRTRFEAGLAPELDVRRAETSVQRLYSDIPPLTEDLKNSRNRLATLTGAFPGAYEQTLAGQKEVPVYRAPIARAVPLDVLRQRPDVRAAEAELRAAVAGIGVAEADLYPSFELTSQIRLGTTGVSSQPTVDVLISSIGALVTQQILDGGERAASIDIAQAQAEAALLDYRQALLEAIEEVEVSLASLEASRDSVEALEAAVESSSRSFQQAEILYQQGLISFLDVVDAQRVLADVEQELAEERTAYAEELAILFRTLGSTVEPAEFDAPPLPVAED